MKNYSHYTQTRKFNHYRIGLLLVQIILLNTILLNSSNLFANTITFEELWKMAVNNSEKIKKSKTETEISALQASRLKNHWTPSVYLRGGYMSTDNAGQALFANMNQRSINPSTDFNPRSINNPGQTQLTEMTMGVAWPIYEGGKYESLKKSSQEMLAAQKEFEINSRTNLKSQLLSSYSKLLNYKEVLTNFDQTIDSINQQLKNYRLGNKNNPVGHSGLLGLKATLNKALAFKNQLLSQMHQEFQNIQKNIPNLDKSWKPQQEPPLSFIQKNTQNKNKLTKSSFLSGQEHITKAMEHKADSEKAHRLPTLGVYAESSQFVGERDNANSVTYGAYLKWNFGWYNTHLHKEIHLKKLAEQYQLQIQNHEETSGKNNLTKWISSLNESLNTAEENKKILEEQLKISGQLYRNGAINAIQLSQIYSNIVDLLIEISQMTSGIIDAETQLYSITSAEGRI